MPDDRTPRAEGRAERSDRPRQSQPPDGRDRGRHADGPSEVPKRGWMDISKRAFAEMNNKNLFLVAGGVTYSVLLALFPGLVALVSLYGLISDPSQVEKQVGAMSGMMPGSAQKLISTELHSIVTSSGGALSTGAVIGILFALYSASRGMSGLMTALDIAYGDEETRGFLRFNLTALGLTLAVIVGGLVAILLVAGVPAIVTSLSTGIWGWVLLIGEWPLLFLFITTGLALLYRYAPDRDEPRWRWLTPGAVTAALLWIVGSILFSVYVSNFSNYNATYGSLGAVVVLLTWLYLSSFIVLLGALINAETERQTRHDTTEGHPLPMGRRDAHAADTVGPAQS